MWERLRFLFKRKHAEEGGSVHPRPKQRRRPSDPNSSLSEVATPPPIQNRDDAEVFLHHTLEESLERSSRGPDTNEDENNSSADDVLVRHHTLEENIRLARVLSGELRRQSDELRRRSEDQQRIGGSSRQGTLH